jgi:putative DNA methylase
VAKTWRGAKGLAADVRYYGQWMREEAEKRIGYLYPKVEVTAETAQERPNLRPLVDQKLTVIAWLWARTVNSPNPAFAHVDVPLASTFMLSTKPGKEAYVEPVIENGSYRFTVKTGKSNVAGAAKNGTKMARGANFRCIMSGTPIHGEYIKAQGQAGRMGARLMAIVAEGEKGRVYLSPTSLHEAVARQANPKWKPEATLKLLDSSIRLDDLRRPFHGPSARSADCVLGPGRGGARTRQGRRVERGLGRLQLHA